MLLRQRKRSGVAVAFVDLDDFKAVNDQHGHHAGDQLLVHVAGKLEGAVRQGDVAARIGGDELVVVGEADDADDAERFVARLRCALQGRIDLDGSGVPVVASVGVTFVEPGDQASPDEVLSRADARMYQIKRRRHAPGRGPDRVRGG